MVTKAITTRAIKVAMITDVKGAVVITTRDTMIKGVKVPDKSTRGKSSTLEGTITARVIAIESIIGTMRCLGIRMKKGCDLGSEAQKGFDNMKGKIKGLRTPAAGALERKGMMIKEREGIQIPSARERQN